MIDLLLIDNITTVETSHQRTKIGEDREDLDLSKNHGSPNHYRGIKLHRGSLNENLGQYRRTGRDGLEEADPDHRITTKNREDPDPNRTTGNRNLQNTIEVEKIRRKENDLSQRTLNGIDLLLESHEEIDQNLEKEDIEKLTRKQEKTQYQLNENERGRSPKIRKLDLLLVKEKRIHLPTKN